MFSWIRITFGVDLKYMLIFFYIVVFILAFFSMDSFMAVAFDSGGVTTGPITVPFIMALGIGMAHMRNSHAEEDSLVWLLWAVSVLFLQFCFWEFCITLKGFLYAFSDGAY